MAERMRPPSGGRFFNYAARLRSATGNYAINKKLKCVDIKLNGKRLTWLNTDTNWHKLPVFYVIS